MDHVTQAKTFVKKNAEQIDLVASKLVQAAQILLSRFTECAKTDPESAQGLAEVRKAHELKDLGNLFSVLRNHAVQFIQVPGMSSIYWEWIDSCGFFFDAVGAQWRYLQQEGRIRYLTWSEEGADKIVQLAQ